MSVLDRQAQHIQPAMKLLSSERHTEDSRAIIFAQEVALAVDMAQLHLVDTYVAMKDLVTLEVDLVVVIKKNSN